MMSLLFHASHADLHVYLSSNKYKLCILLEIVLSYHVRLQDKIGYIRTRRKYNLLNKEELGKVVFYFTYDNEI